MTFSFVIPVYNTEAFLSRCLDSILAQTDKDYEIVVVDDCSPGHCPEILKPYADAVRYVRHEANRSAFQARCTGIRAAKGDYVVPVDPDDYLLPETLVNLRALINRETPDIISYWMDYDDGSRITPHWCRHPSALVSGEEALRELVDHKYFTGVASKVFRRTMLLRALEKLNLPESAYLNTCDDFLLLVAALVVSGKVAFLDYPGYRYFVNEGSTSFSWKTRKGFNTAYAQVRDAARALECMLVDADVRPEVKRLVRKASAGIEAWFLQMRKESSFRYRLIRRIRRLIRARDN